MPEATRDLIGNRVADKTTTVSTEFHSKKSTKELQNQKTEASRASPKYVPEKR